MLIFRLPCRKIRNVYEAEAMVVLELNEAASAMPPGSKRIIYMGIVKSFAAGYFSA